MLHRWTAVWQKPFYKAVGSQRPWITTAVKHQQPRSFFNNCPFYITTNEVPDFGQGEQENVLRRVAVYATQSLPEVNIGADKWIFDNAMDCVAWMAEQINENLQLVDANEIWYEDLDTAAITNTSAQDSCQHIPRVSSADLQSTPSQDLDLLPSPVIHRSFTKEAEKATRTQRRRASVLDSSSSSEVAIPSTVRSPFASPTTSRVSEIVHGVDDDGRLDDDDVEANLPDDGNNGETDRNAGDACDKASRVESKTHQSDDDSDEVYSRLAAQ